MNEHDDVLRSRSLAAVVLLILLAYLPTFASGWVWDDHFVLEENPTLGQLDVLLVSYVYGGGAGSSGCCNYRPLMMLSHAFAQGLWPGPESERTLSLFAHLLAVLLVVGLARRLGASAGWALFAGALLGVHTAASEAVLWPNARSDLLASVVVLAALWAFAHERDLLAGLLLGLGPFFKESLLLAPLLAGVILLGRRRMSWRFALPMLAGWASYLGLREFLDMQVPVGAASTDTLGAVGAVFWRGLELALVPSSVDALPLYVSRPVLGAVALLLGLGAVVASRGRPALAAICAAAFVLVPNAAASAQNGLIGDRYFHLLIGVLSVGLAVVAGRRRLHPMAWLIPVLLASITFGRAGDWQSDAKVFGHSMSSDPDNPFAAFHVAYDRHVRSGDCVAAVPLYERGLEVDLRAGTNLLACLLDLGQHAEVLRRGPQIAGWAQDNPGPPANIARAAMRSGDLASAETWAREACARGAGRASHFVLLGHILVARGKLEDAGEAYANALGVQPGDREAQAGLAALQAQLSEAEGAEHRAGVSGAEEQP